VTPVDEDRVAPVDDKAGIRGELELSRAEWRRAEPAGQHVPGALEIASVPHTDGVTYVAVRQPAQPDGPVLVFTPAEWDAFVAGARDGEFDLPGS
jgi:uncharacterized protein DUF397